MNIPDFSFHDPADKFLLSSIDRWFAIQWTDGIVNPPKGVPYGSHLAAYLYCTPDTGIQSLNYQWIYIDNSGRAVKCCEALVGIEAQWHFIYQTIKKFNLSALNEEQTRLLGLPDLGGSFRSDSTVIDYRKRSDLNSFRFPGYPDDYNVKLTGVFEDPKLLGEQVWVRARKGIERDCFLGEILNDPVSLVHKKGQLVPIRIVNVNNTLILISQNEKN